MAKLNKQSSERTDSRKAQGETSCRHLGETIVGSCDYSDSNSTVFLVLAFTCLRFKFQESY